MYSFKIGSIDRETIPHRSYSEAFKITACIDSALDLFNAERMAVCSRPGGCAILQLNIKSNVPLSRKTSKVTESVDSTTTEQMSRLMWSSLRSASFNLEPNQISSGLSGFNWSLRDKHKSLRRPMQSSRCRRCCGRALWLMSLSSWKLSA